MSKPTIYYSKDFLKHKAPFAHPENEQRLKAIIQSLEKNSFFSCPVVEPRKATRDELLLAHTEQHIEKVKEASLSESYLDPDTYTNKHSYSAALKAAGALAEATESILSKKLKKAFCLVRPPGHHATKDKAMGFCLFNNVAIAAALASKGGHKTAILDFDAHHGNGTQDIFYDTDDVLYCSWHQYPHYPGTGSINEIGVNDGKGYTINIPLEANTTGATLIHSLKQIVLPVLEQFKPDIVIVSAGFDSHQDDPLSALSFSTNSFGKFTSLIKSFADINNAGIIYSLEGGYDLNSLKTSTLKCLEALADNNPEREEVLENGFDNEVISMVISVISSYWDI